MFLHDSHRASRNNHLIITSPNLSIFGPHFQHAPKSTALDYAWPLVHTVSDVGGKESEVVESDAV